jgi:hypothetical protein
MKKYLSEMNTLQKPWEGKVESLAAIGLTLTGRIFLENFMLAEQHGRGHNNRNVLILRLSEASDEQRRAALAVFDDFCRAKGI